MGMKTALLGKYNVYNCLAAIAASLEAGATLKSIQKKLPTFLGAPGRLERLPNSRSIDLFVDFAHTPEALLRTLQTLRFLKRGRLITLFGCGGERDRGKRPLMGAIAEEYSDLVIITSDNPRSEDPMEICLDIAKGFSKSSPIIEVERRRAIERGAQLSQKGDTLLIAGRGHEREQKVSGGQLPFDDRVVVSEVISV